VNVTLLIRQALERIAGHCDGAHCVDGQGFGKADVDFGKSLAAARNWSVKQRACAALLVVKYRRQASDEEVSAAKSVLETKERPERQAYAYPFKERL